jgi:hypothetical protein
MDAPLTVFLTCVRDKTLLNLIAISKKNATHTKIPLNPP